MRCWRVTRASSSPAPICRRPMILRLFPCIPRDGGARHPRTHAGDDTVRPTVCRRGSGAGAAGAWRTLSGDRGRAARRTAHGDSAAVALCAAQRRDTHSGIRRPAGRPSPGAGAAGWQRRRCARRASGGVAAGRAPPLATPPQDAPTCHPLRNRDANDPRPWPALHIPIDDNPDRQDRGAALLALRPDRAAALLPLLNADVCTRLVSDPAIAFAAADLPPPRNLAPTRQRRRRPSAAPPQERHPGRCSGAVGRLAARRADARVSAADHATVICAIIACAMRPDPTAITTDGDGASAVAVRPGVWADGDEGDAADTVRSPHHAVARFQPNVPGVSRRASFPVSRRPSPVVRRSSFVARRPSVVVRRPPSVGRRPSPSVAIRRHPSVRRPSSVVRRSCVARPPSVVRRPPSVARRPSPVRRPPSVRRPSSVARRRPPVSVRPFIAVRSSTVARCLSSPAWRRGANGSLHAVLQNLPDVLRILRLPALRETDGLASRLLHDNAV